MTVEAIKKSGAPMVLFVGRITLQKGPDYFVRAAKKILEYTPDAYFVISGAGDMQTRIMDMVAL